MFNEVDNCLLISYFSGANVFSLRFSHGRNPNSRSSAGSGHEGHDILSCCFVLLKAISQTTKKQETLV